MFRTLLLAALMVAFGAVQLLSERHWALVNMPSVEPVDTLEGVANPAKLARFLDYSSILLPKARPSEEGAESAPALGYSYREISVLRLPLFAYRDQGLVLFVDRPDGIQMVPLDADYLKLLEAEAGHPLAAGYVFPYWKHLWGWVFVAAFLAWLALQRRAYAQRREAAGLI